MNTPTPETDQMKTHFYEGGGQETDVFDLCEKLEQQRDEFARRLNNPVRCHSGHERLPLALWDCPDCVQKIRDENAELKSIHQLCHQETERITKENAALEAENNRLRILIDLSRISLEGQERRYKAEMTNMQPEPWMPKPPQNLRAELDIDAIFAQRDEAIQATRQLLNAWDKYGAGTSLMHPRLTRAINAARKSLPS